MIVVCDTSPLNYLALIGWSELLPRLFDEIHAPPQVIAEMLHARAPEMVRRWGAIDSRMAPCDLLHSQH